jgi:hypothetical protein
VPSFRFHRDDEGAIGVANDIHESLLPVMTVPYPSRPVPDHGRSIIPAGHVAHSA